MENKMANENRIAGAARKFMQAADALIGATESKGRYHGPFTKEQLKAYAAVCGDYDAAKAEYGAAKADLEAVSPQRT